MSNKKQPPKQGPKKGKVIRISDRAHQMLMKEQKKGESLAKVIDRIFEPIPTSGSRVLWVLREPKVTAFNTLGEAIGESIVRQVKKKAKAKEKPTKFVAVDK